MRFPTAKMVWDSIATTYFDGSDTSQVYDLRRRVTQLKQAGGSLEQYYNDLQGLWREIDFRRPNPMECAVDIHKYNTIIQEERVYVFLDGLCYNPFLGPHKIYIYKYIYIYIYI